MSDSLRCLKNERFNYEKIISILNKNYYNNDEIAILLAYEIAHTFSTCRICGVGKGVGIVIVKNTKIIGFGFNGVSERLPACTKKTCIRIQKNIPDHTNRDICYGDCAEKKAILLAYKHGVNLEGGIAYVTKSPCSSCTKMLIDVGINKVVYHQKYSHPEFSEKLMSLANIPCKQFYSRRLDDIALS